VLAGPVTSLESHNAQVPRDSMNQLCPPSLLVLDEALSALGMLFMIVDSTSSLMYANRHAMSQLELFPNQVLEVRLSTCDPPLSQVRIQAQSGHQVELDVWTASRVLADGVQPGEALLIVAQGEPQNAPTAALSGEDQSRHSTMAAGFAELATHTALHTGDRDRFSMAICHVLIRFRDFDDVTIFRFDLDRRAAIPMAYASRREAQFLESGVISELAFDAYPEYTMVSLSGRCLFSRDVSTSSWYGRFYDDVLAPLQIKSLADIPIFSGGVVIGNLSVASTQVHVEWDDSWQSFLQSLAQMQGQCQLAHEKNCIEFEREATFRQLQDAQRLSALATWRLDIDSNALIWSDECFQLLGETDASFDPTIRSLIERIHSEDQARYRTTWGESIAGAESVNSVDYRIRHADGRWRWFRERGRIIRDPDGVATSIWGCSQDVTRDRELEQEVASVRHQDQLTHLLSRLGFEQQLTQQLEAVLRGEGVCALAVVDLIGFAEINMILGTVAGDRILQTVADRLQLACPGMNVGRLGGDVFAVAIPSIDRNEVASLLAKVTQLIADPVNVFDVPLTIAVRVGVAFAPSHARSLAEALSTADLALAHAKQTKASAPVIFREDFRRGAEHRFQVARKLRDAVCRRELQIFYQPVYDCRGVNVVTAEALLRWQHSGKSISPSEFIPVAEMAGLADEIGDLVIAGVTRQIATWRRAGLVAPRVAVNISPLQILSGRAVEMLATALASEGLDAGAIAVELTESGAVSQVEATREFVNEMQSRGIATYIDDFGTGLSSLQYLAELPLQSLKIDRSFVAKLTQKSGSYGSLVVGVIRMAHELGLTVVAEGVETEWQREFLEDSGCDYIQGFLTGRPMSATDFEKLLAVG